MQQQCDPVGTAAVLSMLRLGAGCASASAPRPVLGGASRPGSQATALSAAPSAALQTALVLLGDTPYIDNTDLAFQRKQYREFWSIPELRPLAASVPVYATWDDHEFATNDEVGARPGRENSRHAFVEYHPQPSFGDEEPWEGDPERTSLLGRVQREALIAASTADVKILACGMVWNGAVRPGKRDCWGT